MKFTFGPRKELDTKAPKRNNSHIPGWIVLIVLFAVSAGVIINEFSKGVQ